MRYLIDTHVLIWHGESNETLKPALLAMLNNPANEILVSHASLWEMAIKVSIGKLRLGFPISQLESILLQNNFLLLPFEFAHYEALSKMPFHHNDPFDRMIIAQAQVENIEVVSQDEKFKNYPVKVIWL